MIYHEQQLPEDVINRSLQHKEVLQKAEVREQGTKDARNSSIGWVKNNFTLLIFSHIYNMAISLTNVHVLIPF